MIKNVTGITSDSKKSELDVMTFHDVIIVAIERRETRCGSGYKYPCVHHVQSVDQWAYQAGLVRVGIPSWLSPSGHTNGQPYTKEIFGLVAMMPLTIRASLSSLKD